MIAFVYFEQGVHLDIWLYKRVAMNAHGVAGHSEDMLCNADDQMRYSCRTASHILPLQHSTWLGLNVTIPRAAHSISYLVYGPSYNVTLKYRADCLHNFVHGRLWYNRFAAPISVSE